MKKFERDGQRRRDKGKGGEKLFPYEHKILKKCDDFAQLCDDFAQKFENFAHKRHDFAQTCEW